MTDVAHRADPEKKSLLSAATKITHCTPTIGTEISGIDLRQLSDSQKDELCVSCPVLSCLSLHLHLQTIMDMCELWLTCVWLLRSAGRCSWLSAALFVRIVLAPCSPGWGGVFLTDRIRDTLQSCATRRSTSTNSSSSRVTSALSTSTQRPLFPGSPASRKSTVSCRSVQLQMRLQ